MCIRDRQEPRFSPGTNISITSFVLFALKDQENKQVNEARSKAGIWIKRVRNKDHGFYFHPKKDHSGNKAEWLEGRPEQPKSYGTATVDGMRAMRSLRLPSKQISETANWLTRNSETEQGITFVPGFELVPRNRDGSWGQGLLYYYLMSLALEKQNLPESFRKACLNRIPRYLLEQQKENGSWENSSARMREDDPLIATPLALIALAQFQK